MKPTLQLARITVTAWVALAALAAPAMAQSRDQILSENRALLRERWEDGSNAIANAVLAKYCGIVDAGTAATAMQRVGEIMAQQQNELWLTGDPAMQLPDYYRRAVQRGQDMSKPGVCDLTPAQRAQMRQAIQQLAY
jgi:hypothetical protein